MNGNTGKHITAWLMKHKGFWSGIFAFFAGAAATLIFPPFIDVWQGYVALVLFLALLLGKPRTKKSLFWLAYFFGFAFYAVGFSWINKALLLDSDEFAAFVPAVFLATGTFFGLFWALPAIVAFWGRNIYSRIVLFSTAFVAFEWVRSFIFTGFPWNLLGTALCFDVKLIQMAAYIGTYGLSLLLLLACGGAAALFAGAVRRKFYTGALALALIPVAIIGLGGVLYQKSESGEMKVRLVQPNIPQQYKWEAAEAYANFRAYIDLSKSRPLDGVKLVVWGETATPYFLDRDWLHLREITEAVLYQIQQSGYADKLRNGVVITGGGANLRNLPMMIRDMSGYTVRVGYPRTQVFSSGGCPGATETSAATVIGMILEARKDRHLNCILEARSSEPATETTAATDSMKASEPAGKEQEMFGEGEIEIVQSEGKKKKEEKKVLWKKFGLGSKIKKGLEGAFDNTVGGLFDDMQ